MNYRHSFHAGNSADVVKHSLLIALVRALQQKEGGLTLIDTHAGCGLYDLQGDQAQRTGESTQGVMRAFADTNPLLDDYRAAVRAVNVGDEPRLYPGSPRFLAQLLRPQDLLILNEKHPEDAYALRGVMRDTQAAVHERDAYELWLAMVPPRTSRGVVVVDPPYEQTDERARITATLAAAHRKWAHGVTVIWYPLKERPTHAQWKHKLRRLGIPKFLSVEHWLYDSDQPGIYNGAGLFIVNPPYAFTQALSPMLEALRAALAPEGHKGQITADWLGD
ncbi:MULTISPECIES: 23S rRNA (adenine(2030)-N(6))-methyltransferase RlmJ [unclassified Novosphingobium]|uniref:23S rRNA (adenine(2030)-N(6))-methyltransferase RlmJ n=1 Tax=unclassified Novosphingobium TaxID=2644732 RepID=UPI00086D4A8D|nr:MULTISPECIES: 23S rRNA (adenine(2030)-N(6))-methyltransferase RlmJ [unclassified Novosphingobium]MBN9142277.1 23S rRNA (adenine(2030)-N(6))-methyltransferase RlmJ [Novosphingobium sp.]MDR6710334.1 23S rRNA (adenine2030-N6)-methyltransferase [Novosphingobium sp. 1748]ODU78602.1 MAG: 23S rRNA (adenine(2030)-N(6))-methyltransferase RlmJ [Novosphingobium sp. SCN 63-17]OJX90533.1 MAG: 23S rRNA (adenine(2030)-N(6))-methyltransferase RlmJ [Novosphingobium sp. 63-713]